MNREQKLNKRDAHDEANLLRTQGEINRDGQRFSVEEDKFVEATPEDYDEAIKKVEELKRLAAKDPAWKKVLMELGRQGVKARFLFLMIFRALSVSLVMQALVPTPEGKKRVYTELDEVLSQERKRFKDDMEWLDDATNKLNVLKKEAEERVRLKII